MLKTKRKMAVALISLSMLVAGSIFLMEGAETIDGRLIDQSVLVSRGRILIDGDSEFTSMNGVLSGTGTPSDPYVIENWSISASSGNGIQIRDTVSHFIIRNCWIVDGGGYFPGYDGIALENVQNGTVTNCLLEGNGNGIHVTRSSRVTIDNNTCMDANYGILVADWTSDIALVNNICTLNGKGILLNNQVTDSIIANNTCKRNLDHGIKLLYDCDNNLIEYNDLSETIEESVVNDRSGIGIELYNSHDNVIKFNDCSKATGSGMFIVTSNGNRILDNYIEECRAEDDGLSRYGILLSYCRDTELRDNVMVNCSLGIGGRDLVHWISNSIDGSNKVNGRSIRFILNSTTSETIAGDESQIILVNCRNKVIRGMEFDDLPGAISVFFSRDIEIDDIEFSHVDEGMVVEDSRDVTISKVSIEYFRSGMDIYGSDRINITDSIFRMGHRGISGIGMNWSLIENCTFIDVNESLWIGGFPDSFNNTVSGNNIRGGINAVTFQGSDNNFTKNFLEGIDDMGLWLFGVRNSITGNHFIDMDSGISVTSSGMTSGNGGDRIEISENRFLRNKIGIDFLFNARNFDIYSNNFSLCSRFAIDISDELSYGTAIYNNSFYRNNQGGVQAFDGSGLNTWDDNSSLGNYWSDYQTRYVPPATNDGSVWSVPYDLMGYTGSSDRYPLVKDPGSISPILRISGSPPSSIMVGEKYVAGFTMFYSGEDADSIVWSFRSDGSWLSFDGDQVLSGIPAAGDVGICWVNISLTAGQLKDFMNFTINVISSNRAPKITTTDITNCTEDLEYSVDYDAEDESPLIWSLSTGAGFLIMDPSTGLLSGTPSNDDVGHHNVKVTVSDGFLEDSTEFILEVVNMNDPPTITAGDVTSVRENDHYEVLYTANDIDPTEDDLTWSLVTDAPFLSLDPDTGLLAGDPWFDHSGLYSVEITVDDGRGGSDVRTFQLEVMNLNRPPTDPRIDILVQELREDEAQNVSASAEDLDIPFGDELIYEWFVEGSGLIGTGPLIDLDLEAGNYTLVLRVTDSSGMWVETSLLITVLPVKGVAPTPPSEGPSSSSVLILIMLIGAAVLLFGIASAVLLVIRRRSQRRGANRMGFDAWSEVMASGGTLIPTNGKTSGIGFSAHEHRLSPTPDLTAPHGMINGGPLGGVEDQGEAEIGSRSIEDIDYMSDLMESVLSVADGKGPPSKTELLEKLERASGDGRIPEVDIAEIRKRLNNSDKYRKTE